jgi:Tol biopolymer transport system component
MFMVRSTATLNRHQSPLRLFALLMLVFILLVMSLQNIQAQTPSSPADATATTATNAIIGTATALASMLERNEQILFFSARERGWDTYLMNADGTDETLVTAQTGGMRGYEAVFSPDRTHIAFINSSEDYAFESVYLIKADGTDLSLVMEDPSSDVYITWLPNGKQLGFVSYRDEGRNIYVTNLDGSEITRLTPNDGSVNHSPHWSPDGKNIAFFSNKDGKMNLYLMNADGSNVRQITNDQDTAASLLDTVSWSPDSQSLVFTSTRDGHKNLYTITLESSEADQLTYRGENRSPTWSPDGTKIAFISTRGDRRFLYTVKPNGLGLKALAEDSSLDFSCPVWMSDSQRIVVVGYPVGEPYQSDSDLYLVKADGTGITPLTDDEHGSMVSHCTLLFG